MRFPKKVFLIIQLTVILTSFSCNKTPTESDSTIIYVEPGSRDYEWTIDTLDITYYVNRLWGSSPTSLWAISESDYYNNILHFNGVEWTNDGIYRDVSPHALYGFSYDNVFLGGMNGKIWRFDGSTWNQIVELKKEGTDFIAFENIWGESKDDFYAVGNGPDKNLFANFSVIVHYKNNKWNMINTGDLIGDVVHLYKNKTDGKIYLQVIKVGGAEFPDSTLIYEYVQSKYKKIYSSVEAKGLLADISLIDDEVYFILGNEIAKRKNNKFQTILKIDNNNFYQRMWGRSSKDIFLLMTDGLAHYNGNDIEYLFYFNVTPRTQIYGAAIFEKEVFFAVDESKTNKKLIYHGKLKE